MASYHIWNPCYVSEAPVVLECHLTEGEALQLARGSDRLVASALAALGIDAEPVRWSVDAMRTHYFSSYRNDGTSWEDAWALVWRLRAELSDVRPLAEVPGWGYLDLEGVDDSYRSEQRPDLWDAWPCLVLADLTDPVTAVDARRVVARHCPGAEVATGLAFGKLPQLRCDLGLRPRAFYEQGAQESEELLSSLVAIGASVHQEESLEILRRQAEEAP